MENSKPKIVEPLAQRGSSVRVAKSQDTANVNQTSVIDRFAKQIFGDNNQKQVFYVSLFFLVCAFLFWQFMGLAQQYIITPANEISSVWSWVSSTCFFFYTMFLGLGIITFFFYLTRRF